MMFYGKKSGQPYDLDTATTPLRRARETPTAIEWPCPRCGCGNATSQTILAVCVVCGLFVCDGPNTKWGKKE